MKLRVYGLALAVLLISLGYNVWYWGGAARSPDLGPILTTAAAREAPLVDAYLSLGGAVLDFTPWAADAQADAERALAPARQRILDQPRLAIDELFDHRYDTALSVLVISHWVAPLALLVTLIAWLRRPKAIQTRKMGRRF